ncbi:Bromodomain containing protein [Parasponia andersonii]|uniref:Bromodomain containing protein n=1 Tax=Parasponia andersonii TaxID=3476 RepID=A0A2P5BRQ4_PARAD|nr:Bromodomain containing protein [Parasponia andersonii]
MMGQIVRRKKKGRPSKADLAARRSSGESPATTEPDLRRSHRRRNVRYNIDYDDYLDEDEEGEVDNDEDEDDEDERRREKKLKLVVKLNQGTDEASDPAPTPPQEASRVRSGSRAAHAAETDSDDEGSVRKRKRRRISGGGPGDEEDEVEEEEEDGDGGHGGDDDDEEEERGRKVDSKRLDSVPGTPSDPQSKIPLPEKKTLELILDKLQKKDTYGVYAEPVDLEELPDYLDVIDHPMDFATVRKKLANGSYSTLDQFESDVFLICSNAMQYNGPETIYHKQARSIQELARKKFEKLRIKYKCSEKELKLVQKIKSNSIMKKQIKKPLNRTSQEAVGSDFSSGATLATAGDVQNGLNITQGGVSERPGNNDGPVEGNSSLNDANLEKVEETSSAKGFLSRLGRKPVVLDDNRRATYNISNQPVVRSESVFTTFECEVKQLVAVGLHAEYAYARSLARFAATLGPVAWKVASQRIEQALPAGCKFGCGWVGEYEPLPTPVLMLENHNQKQSGLVTRYNSIGEMRKDDRAFRTPVPMKEQTVSGPFAERRQSLFLPARGPQSEAKPSAFSPSGPQSEAKPSAFSSTGSQSEVKPSAFVYNGMKPSSNVNAIHQQQNAQSRTFSKPEINVPKQVELNSLPTANQNNADLTAEKQFSRKSEAAASKLRDTAPRHVNPPQTLPFKLPDSNGVVTGGLPNGKDMKISLDRRMSSPSDSGLIQTAKGTAQFPHGQEQGVSDPAQLMKMLANRTQKQQKSSDSSVVDSQQVMPSVPSVRRDDSNNAAAAAARAWMSIGAGAFKQPAENPITPKSQISADSLYNPTREFQSQVARIRGDFPVSGAMQFQPEKNSFQVPAFLPQPVRLGNDAHFQNRPIIFPQLAAADLSRFQMQSPWRGLSPHAPPRQKQDTLPPDLNIGFQSPGSPVKQSSGVLVESQQPDLALQL